MKKKGCVSTINYTATLKLQLRSIQDIGDIVVWWHIKKRANNTRYCGFQPSSPSCNYILQFTNRSYTRCIILTIIYKNIIMIFTLRNVYPKDSSSFFTSKTSMCPGACVMHNDGLRSIHYSELFRWYILALHNDSLWGHSACPKHGHFSFRNRYRIAKIRFTDITNSNNWLFVIRKWEEVALL